VVKSFSVEAAVPAAMPWIVAGGTPATKRQTNGAQRRGYNISVLSVVYHTKKKRREELSFPVMSSL
jgi:hypothetical protein